MKNYLQRVINRLICLKRGNAIGAKDSRLGMLIRWTIWAPMQPMIGRVDGEFFFAKRPKLKTWLYSVVKTHSKRMKRNVLERTELNYEQEEEKLRQKSLNRTWYWFVTSSSCFIHTFSANILYFCCVYIHWWAFLEKTFECTLRM